MWAIPAPTGGSRALLRPHELVGAGRGPAGPRLHLLPRGRARAARAARQEHRPGADRADPRSARRSTVGDAVFFVAGEPDKFAASSPVAARTQVGRELNLIDENRFEFCWIVDFPMFEWNEEEKKIDFSHNPFSMPNIEPDAFLALDNSDKDTLLDIKADPVRHRLQRHRAVVRRDPQPPARTIMQKAFAIAGYRRRRAREQVRRHAARASARRPAARRHRARHRPHRDAALRRGEPARGRCCSR